MKFNTWLDTYIEEKNINPNEIISVEGASGTNYMTYEYVLDILKNATATEQKKAKHLLVMLDFKNADIREYLKMLARLNAI